MEKGKRRGTEREKKGKENKEKKEEAKVRDVLQRQAHRGAKARGNIWSRRSSTQ